MRVGKPFGHKEHKDRRGDTADQGHDLRHIGQTAAKIIDVVYRHDDKRDQLKLEPIQSVVPFERTAVYCIFTSSALALLFYINNTIMH